MHIKDAIKSLARSTPGVQRIYRDLAKQRKARAIARKVHRRRMRAARQASELEATTAPPILVYQMSKVGSKTVYHSLKSLNLENPVFHVHSLAIERLDAVEATISQRLSRAKVPFDVLLGYELRERLLPLEREIKIVTLVRDPIARDVSSMMHVPEYRDPTLRTDNGHVDIDRCAAMLNERFQRKDACTHPEDWFKRELEGVFAIDVFAYPFDLNRGFAILRKGKVSVLVLRMEDMSDHMGTALAEFLDLEEAVPMIRQNVRAETSDADLYEQLKSRIRVPVEACRRIYSRPFSRHFYTDEMITRFIRKWSGAGQYSALYE